MYKGERFSGYSHLLGSILAVAGLVVLVVASSRDGDPWKIVSVAIYGSTLVLLFSFSTLYHSLKGRAKSIFQKFDHISIYVLIAGTYTPFSLVTLRSTWGWTLFGMIWGLAVLGAVVDILHRQGSRALQMAIYFIMGWLVVIAMPQLMDALPAAGIYWLVTGGLFYTVGIVFYAIDERMRHAHGIWHLFVLAGSISHYIAVLFYVI